MKHIYRIFIVIAIVLLGGLVAISYTIKPEHSNKGVNVLKNETEEEAFENIDVKIFEGDKPLRVLVLGVDKSATVDQTEEQNGMRSDTIMLFTADPVTNKVQILSLPRDSYIDIHGYGKNKLNAAFSEIVYPKDGGFGLTVKTIEDFLDVEIDHYAIVDYKAVSSVVDAVGGIDIEWKYPDYTYTDDWVVPPLKIELKNGINHLDGKKAVDYLRTRKAYPNQDIGRIGAQQEFLLLLFEKIKSPAIIFKIPELVDIVDKYVETDLNYSEIAQIAKYALGVEVEDISTATLEGTNRSGVLIGKDLVDVYEVDREEARKLVHDFPNDTKNDDVKNTKDNEKENQ